MVPKRIDYAKPRRVVLDLEGVKDQRVVICWRVWQKPEILGLQMDNNDNTPHKWMWVHNARIISYTVEDITVEEIPLP